MASYVAKPEKFVLVLTPEPTIRTRPCSGFVPLLDSLARPAVAASPIRALRAGFSVGVVDTLFMRTADDAVSNDNGFDFV